MRPFAVGALLLTLLPASISAEPIIVTGGSFVTAIDTQRGGALDVSGTGDSAFHVTWFAPGFIEARVVCGVGNCRPGDVVGPDALFTVDTEPFLGSAEQAATGSARVNGVSYGGIPFVSFTGRLEFDGDPFVLPAPETLDGLVRVDVPFVFSGVLNGFDIFRFETLQLFSAELQGSGTAHLSFGSLPIGAEGRLRFVRTEYRVRQSDSGASHDGAGRGGYYALGAVTRCYRPAST